MYRSLPTLPQAATTPSTATRPTLPTPYLPINIPLRPSSQPGLPPPPPPIAGPQIPGLLPFPMWPPLQTQLPPPPPQSISSLLRSTQAAPLLPPPLPPQAQSTSTTINPTPYHSFSNVYPAIPLTATPPTNSGVQPSLSQRMQHRANRHYVRRHAQLQLANARSANNAPPTINPLNGLPTIIQVERIQNLRWYKQYSAHECEFRQKLGRQTQKWLFHGRFIELKAVLLSSFS